MGFLSLDNEEAPGNLGLWDQAMAIRWVNREVKELFLQFFLLSVQITVDLLT